MHEIISIPEIVSVKKKLPDTEAPEEFYMNTSVVYALGVICGKGSIDYENRTLHLSMKNWLNEAKVIEGFHVSIDAIEAHEYAANDIATIFDNCAKLLDEELNSEITPKITDTQITTIIKIAFPEDSQFLAFIHKSFNGKKLNSEYKIPDYVKVGSNDLKRSFLRGYSDVASLISKGTQTFGSGRFRIYINVYGRNVPLFTQLIHLFSEVGVQPHAHDRHKTAEYDKREMQIRVYPERFQTVGFNVAWKKRLLYDFIRANYDLRSHDNYTKTLL